MTNFMNIHNFKKQFIDINFDKILIDNSNELVNSNEYYINYKNRYLKYTSDNLDTYNKLLEKYNVLYNNELVTETGKVRYYIVDSDELNNIRFNINKLLINQTQLYNNFVNHIDYINENKHKLTKIKKTNDNSNFTAKKLLSKLKL